MPNRTAAPAMPFWGWILVNFSWAAALAVSTVIEPVVGVSLILASFGLVAWLATLLAFLAAWAAWLVARAPGGDDEAT